MSKSSFTPREIANRLCAMIPSSWLCGAVTLRVRGGRVAAIEFWNGPLRERLVALDEPAYTIGSDVDAVTISINDPTVSGVHCGLERVGKVWLIRDLGSRNGTRVGNEVLVRQHRLKDGDEILLGRTRLIFRDRTSMARPTTDALLHAPTNLTRAEKRVLVELCRPLLSHHTFQPPASVNEIAARLFVGKNAVQAHLTHLYDKFSIHTASGTGRRVQLANEAILRGAVTLADLRSATETGSDL